MTNPLNNPINGTASKGCPEAKETIMAYRGHYSSGRSGYSGGGFTNHRTGTYVSAARAHQHVGQSFGGFTKTRSSASGNFYMKGGSSNRK